MSLSETAQMVVERAAERTIAKLWAALDAGDLDGAAASFADDGVWHRQGKQLGGPAGVRAAMAERPKAARTRHVVTNVLIDAIDDANAEMQFYLTVYQHMAETADAPPPAPMNLPLTVALSKARIIKTASGWKIRELSSADMFRRK
jgi:ketosteroid isomerase-like protein